MGGATVRGRGAGRRWPLGWGERLRDHLDDTTWLVQDALARGEHVLLEGAQGTLLDLDHGSYPFVTSSNPVAGGACTGGGIGPLQVDEVIGVMKAYSTRVGSGPYPTELHDEIGAGHRRARPRVRDRHRPAAPGRLVRRRPAALRGRRQQRQLDHAQQARHPVGHRDDPAVRRLRDRRPARRDAGRRAARRSSRATPIYEDFPGWAEPIHDVRSLADLPENARRYVSAIEEHAGVPIVLVSVGPERTQTIERAWRPMRHRRGAARHEPLDRCRPGSSIVGGGGREHALAWKLAAEPGVNEVIVAPGSDAHRRGAAGPLRCRASIRSTRPRSSALARREAVELVVIGPEAPLAAGVADALAAAGIAVFGPTRGGRPDRGSKAFCHEVAERGRRPDGARPGRSTTGRRPRGLRRGPRRRRAAASWSRRTGWPPARA